MSKLKAFPLDIFLSQAGQIVSVELCISALVFIRKCSLNIKIAPINGVFLIFLIHNSITWVHRTYHHKLSRVCHTAADPGDRYLCVLKGLPHQIQ